MDNTSRNKRFNNRIGVAIAASLIATVTLTGATADLPVAAQSAADLVAWEEGVEPSRVVLLFDGQVPETIPSYVAELGGVVVMRSPLPLIVVMIDPDDSRDLIALASADERVVAAEYDRYVSSMYTPNDLVRPASHNMARLPEAWDITRGSHDVSIHILDTGIDHTHLDLLPNLSPMCDDPLAAGWSTIGTGAPGGQESGFHGTHVAGIAGAVINNTLGIAGASQSCMTSVRVLAADTGLVTWVVNGIMWSVANGADVISMSLGGPVGTTALEWAVNYAESQGVLVVAAAGNDDCAPVGYPAAYESVLAVGAAMSTTSRASFSSCGPEVEISAPGSGIWSTLPANTYGPLSGTSMATPLVAGIAGLVWDVNPGLTNVEVRCILTATANRDSHNNQMGWGLVDAYSAVTVAQHPIAAVQDGRLDLAQGVCPKGIFEEETTGPVMDPGHAYVDVHNNGVFDEDVDVAIATEAIHTGSYVVEEPLHGLVIPPSVGPVASESVTFRSGSEARLLVRVDLAAGDRVELHGGSSLDLEGVHAVAGGRMDLVSGGSIAAAEAIVEAANLQVEAYGTISFDGASLGSTVDLVFATGEEIHASGALVQGQSGVRFKSAGAMALASTTLMAIDGNVRMDAGGTVSL